MVAKSLSKAMPDNIQMTGTPLGTFSPPTKVINRNVAESAAVKVQVEVAVDVSRITQEVIFVIRTFFRKEPNAQCNAIWYPEDEENTRAANAEIKSCTASMEAALTLHNKNLGIQMEDMLKENQEIAMLNTVFNTKVEELTKFCQLFSGFQSVQFVLCEVLNNFQQTDDEDVIDGKPVAENLN